ncbi:unnamed protein product [Arabidopsis halleri]
MMVANTRVQVLAKETTVPDDEETSTAWIGKALADQNAKIEKNTAEMFAAIRMISEKVDLMANAGSQSPVASAFDVDVKSEQGIFNVEVPRRARSGLQPQYSGVTRLAKLDFPRFGGDRVKDWLFKVEQFFSLDLTPDDFKVRMCSIHFDGPAAAWHQSLYDTDLGIRVMNDWVGYKRLLLERFAEVLDDPIAELKNLRETNGIKEYHEKFEEIRLRLRLPEDYLVRAYLAGLRTDTQMHIRMFQPTTISKCWMLGRLYEQAHQQKGPGVTSHVNQSSRWSGNSGFQTKGVLGSKPDLVTKQDVASKPREIGTQPRKFLSTEELNRRRSQGLCYFCDEKYSPEHYLTHKKKQLYMMDVEECESEETVDYHSADEGDSEVNQEHAQVSVSAVSGVSDYRTMKVRGYAGKQALIFLLDSGSTHNFLDPKAATRLNLQLQHSGLTRVKVADGRQLGVSGKAKNFQWKLQETTFEGDVMVIPLAGCDMVLGVQWLATLGSINWDFKKLEMRFKWGLKTVMLHGLKQGSIREVKATKLKKIMENDVQVSMLCVQEFSDSTEPSICSLEIPSHQEEENPKISHLVQDFADIFAEPTALPPFRANHDHKIPLLEGSNPINQRPYRYALHQKNEIDKMVQELLSKGTIQPSSSPYASPVVLVKKKDGSWRLCVDYRGLNGMTVKDRFPIPLIDDLMDELGGSAVYSKIDLRAGYHQVRMDPNDTHKTAFKTHSGHYEYLVMPFGLTNAPATFQSLMNTVFQDFLRKFVLIFFDDILIYSPDLEVHLLHLREVFQVMRLNALYAKRSKCAFAVTRVEYLGHFIEAQGISTDPQKVLAVQNWPVPKTVKQLRGFLGLAGYYRKFVKGFGVIARPLHDLTKKDSFAWSEAAAESFERLKQVLCEAPVLALPQFNKPFVVETDACGEGIGAVLMQEGHPLSYISRHLKGKQLHLSIYEKELLAVVFAVQKWRHYLLSSHFIIKTDQRSLKYLLEQRLNTPIQQQWLPKLLEFDYEIQYKQGKDNIAADALSRVEGAEVLHMAMSVLDCDLMQRIKASYDTDFVLKEIVESLKGDPQAKKHFSWVQGVLRRKSKIVIPADKKLKDDILQWLHCSGSGGHSGRDVTCQRVKGLFWWKGMAKDIHTYIRSCSVCQRCKYETVASPGLLQPLPIPETIWTDISMDFIDGLPPSFGKTVIFVVVDRLSKAAHFMALTHPYSAVSVAQVFMDQVFKLHGFPKTIVSDRDTVFLSDFWTELFSLQGVSLNYTSAYHPQSDGQTEVVNRCLETYLRCMCSDRPHLWSKWLPLAEFWYNTNYHTAIQMSPYEAVYGQPPPVHLPYLPGESKVAVVAQCLQDRENMLLLLRFHLLRAQHRMTQNANLHRTERSFEIGDVVYVKLQPYRQHSVVLRSNQKLSPKYFGPYKILDKCGAVAYRLDLPTSSKIHPVFHVSQLKESVGPVSVSTELPSVHYDALIKEPERVLERKMVNRQGRAATMVLVKWTNLTVEEATWEYLFDLPVGDGSIGDGADGDGSGDRVFVDMEARVEDNLAGFVDEEELDNDEVTPLNSDCEEGE